MQESTLSTSKGEADNRAKKQAILTETIEAAEHRARAAGWICLLSIISSASYKKKTGKMSIVFEDLSRNLVFFRIEVKAYSYHFSGHFLNAM